MRGLGAAHVELFAREGASVVFGGVLDEEAGRLKQALREQGPQETFCHLDVTQPEKWDAAVALARSTYGNLTTLRDRHRTCRRRGLAAH
ncbi:SDR family oxidoreductase [Pseudofrankia sp. BMG5.37]|uniref:SDR family oxidoreductase n=1 Tax=Pseudofrankia sp. BMG5.37 TaxID=3050035 RepID=UPI0012FF7378